MTISLVLARQHRIIGHLSDFDRRIRGDREFHRDRRYAECELYHRAGFSRDCERGHWDGDDQHLQTIAADIRKAAGGNLRKAATNNGNNNRVLVGTAAAFGFIFLLGDPWLPAKNGGRCRPFSCCSVRWARALVAAAAAGLRADLLQGRSQ